MSQLQSIFVSLRGIIIFASLIFSGCASFPDHKIAKVEDISISQEYAANKPSVYIPITFLTNLSSGDEKGYVESAAPLPTLKRLIEKMANDLSLFKDYSFETFQAQNMDFVLKIEMLNHGSSGKAVGAGLITGLTLFVIPSVATDNYTLTGKVYDKSGKLLKTYSYEDSMSTWIGLWLLPVAGNTLSDAVDETFSNMLKALFRDILNDKILEKK
ncbi:hypothetical protein [Methylotuvimicrobium sp. KM1]|uniref:hypothetical protein n=1 Tax=Methylotuvimicrobium sp. KM1 TaxID=3377707 RepID=UPI00384FF1CF